MTLSRRMLLHAGLATGAMLALAPRSLAQSSAQTSAQTGAQTGMPAWHLGYATPPAKGLGPTRMRLISGRAPQGLAGALYRNGPAQFRYGSAYASHWFDGDGMVHRIAIADGQAVHTGRYVATPKRAAEQKAQKFLAPGFGTRGDPDFPVESSDDVNAANTSVMMSGGELLALWEAGSAFRLDPVTLETRGPKVWRPDLKAMPFLAHPKREPDGRVWNLAVNGPQVGIYRISPQGALEDFGVVDVGAASYIHDWTMTARKLVILVQPWIRTRQIPPFIDGFEWRPHEGMKILVVDKDDLAKRRWSQAPARAFYHTGAAWEESDGTIRLDAAFYMKPALGAGGAADRIRGKLLADDVPPAELTQMVIPPRGEARLIASGRMGEFPQVDPRRCGQPRRYTALVTSSLQDTLGPTGLGLHDWEKGRTEVFDLGASHLIEEHLFVPKPGGRDETDAWLVGTALNIRDGATEFMVFDVEDVRGGPVAVWRADYSWPLGFHGTWT